MTTSRKQIKKTNYFSHDSNARNDSKIISLRMKLGVEGYGIYFMIIERLREEADYISNKDYDSLAFDFRTTPEKVKSVIEDFGLFIFTDDDCFYSESLMQRMNLKDEKSKKHSLGGKKAMEKRWNNTPETAQNNKDAITNLPKSDNIVITNLPESDNKESKVKESKGKESKEEESKGKCVEPHTQNIMTFHEKLSLFKTEYMNSGRFEKTCMTLNVRPDVLQKYFNEFTDAQECGSKHEGIVNYAEFSCQMASHFYNTVKFLLKKENESKPRNAFNDTLNELLILNSD